MLRPCGWSKPFAQASLSRLDPAFHFVRDYREIGSDAARLRQRSSDAAARVRYHPEEVFNAEVAAARPVRVRILPRAEAFQIADLIRTKIHLLPEGIAEVRTVEIVGLDLQTDGGTHVASTAEVGPIRIVDHKSRGRINKRLVIALE